MSFRNLPMRLPASIRAIHSPTPQNDVFGVRAPACERFEDWDKQRAAIRRMNEAQAAEAEKAAEKLPASGDDNAQ